MKWTKRMACATALAVVALVGGCASGYTRVASRPPPSYTSLGTVTGSACGSLGVVSTAYYVIPIGLNSRVQRAYIDALSKAPGATALINVTVREDWYWWLIGTARCVKVTGEAVK